MRIGSTEILDTHAEAFNAWYARLIVSADDEHWLRAAIHSVTGYGTSVIGCDAEVGVERAGALCDSPDRRPAAAVFLFAFTSKLLEQAVTNRVGECVLTCPTAACFDGTSNGEKEICLGDDTRYFGDGHETQTIAHGRRVWKIPVMDGEFTVERTAHAARGVGGGNLIIQATTQKIGLAAAQRAAGAAVTQPGVILPFPGGVCRSGSKSGSIYNGLKAATNAPYCPSLRDQVQSQLAADATCAYEVVINGTDEKGVRLAMRSAIEAAVGDGVVAIGAGNYGGALGKINIQLRQLFE